MKKALGETQTLRASCSKAEPKNFAPPQTPLPGGTGWPKFNQLEMVTTFTYRSSLVRIDARLYRVIVVTDPHTQANKHTGPITIHCAAS